MTRVSFIEFLNALPLGWGLMHGEQAGLFDLIFDVPSECSRHLAGGEVDLGLIPVIEYLRIEDLKVLPGISIASRREVRSVIFVSRLPIEEVSRVAVDTSSRTSAALLTILMRRFYGNHRSRLVGFPPDPERMLEQCEAALLIGNPALKVTGDDLHVYDLAREWNRFTGLPFVFAFWAVRPGVSLSPRERDAFYASRECGVAAIDEIARIYAPRLGLSEGEVDDYLSNNLDFSLDEANLEGLREFFRLARQEGLVEHNAPLRFL